MTEILGVLKEYEGSGIVFALYLIALVTMLFRDDNKENRVVFLYLPLTILALFLLPPFHKLYAAVEGSDTYYRMLWLLPMSVTIGYALVRTFVDRLWIGVAVLCAALVFTGSYTYRNVNILKAENRLHIPQSVIDVCDFLLNETQGERAMVAMPVGFVQFVRQYDSRIWMPYGREMLMPQWGNYYHAVYEAMSAEALDAAALGEAVREYSCDYMVVEGYRTVDIDLEAEGMTLLGNVDGYNIYRVEP